MPRPAKPTASSVNVPGAPSGERRPIRPGPWRAAISRAAPFPPQRLGSGARTMAFPGLWARHSASGRSPLATPPLLPAATGL